MTRLTLATALCLLPATAFAETQLERFEALSGELNAVMIDMLANDVEAQGGDGTALRDLDGMMPPWSDEIRTAAGCVLDGYVADTSTQEVDAMLDKMDEVLPTLSSMTMTEATDNGVLEAMMPSSLSDERMLELNKACGMIELQMEASKGSGFVEAMMAAGSTIPGNN